MEFFDKTQDVIDIQLTSYGKQKLSEGDFSPAFYAFYDPGILYDGGHGPIIESQNNIENRINSTPQLKAQAYFSASSVSENYVPHSINYDFNNLTIANAKYFRVLGRNDPWSNFAPAWNIKTILNSKTFTGAQTFKSALAIPTFPASLETTYSGFDNTNPNGYVYTLENTERLLIDVSEINAIRKGKGNFDIEVFEVSDDGQNKLKRLSFISEGPDAEKLTSQTKPYEVVGTLQGTSEEIRGDFPVLDSTYVEYFLSIRVDDEIIDVSTVPGSKLYKSQYESTPSEDVCVELPFPEVD